MRRPIKTAMSSKTGQVPSTYKRATQAQGALGDTIFFSFAARHIHVWGAAEIYMGLAVSLWVTQYDVPVKFWFPLACARAH